MNPPPGASIASFLRGALRAYASLARSIAGVLLFLGSVAAATGAIVVPLWLLASRRPGLYSWLVAGLAALGCAAALILGIRRQSKASGGAGAWLKHRFLPFLGRLAFLVLSLGVLYGLLLLFASHRYVLGGAVALLYVLLLGWRAYRKRAPERSSPAPSPADADGDGNPA